MRLPFVLISTFSIMLYWVKCPAQQIDDAYRKLDSTNKSLKSSILIIRDSIQKLNIKNNTFTLRYPAIQDSIKNYKQLLSTIDEKQKVSGKKLNAARQDTAENSSRIEALKKDSISKIEEVENQINKQKAYNDGFRNEIKKIKNDYEKRKGINENQAVITLQEKLKAHMNDYSSRTKGEILKIITSPNFEESEIDELDGLVASLPCDTNAYKLFRDSVKVYKETVNFVRDVRKFLDKEYSLAEYNSIKTKHPKINVSTKLFNNDQTNKLKWYVDRLEEYCSIFGYIAGQINFYTDKTISAGSADYKQFSEFLNQEIDSDLTYLIKSKREFIQLLIQGRFNELKYRKLTINQCP